jgi:hypothetical protein
LYHLDQVRWLYDEACGHITFRVHFQCRPSPRTSR